MNKLTTVLSLFVGFRSVEGLDARGKKKKMKKKETKMAAAAYAAVTDEDWCVTQAHECAMLLGESVESSRVESGYCMYTSSGHPATAAYVGSCAEAIRCVSWVGHDALAGAATRLVSERHASISGRSFLCEHRVVTGLSPYDS